MSAADLEDYAAVAVFGYVAKKLEPVPPEEGALEVRVPDPHDQFEFLHAVQDALTGTCTNDNRLRLVRDPRGGYALRVDSIDKVQARIDPHEEFPGTFTEMPLREVVRMSGFCVDPIDTE